MGNPETLPVEERARKLLAAQYQRDHPDRAKRILAGASDKAAVDAVVTALAASQQQLAEAVEVLQGIADEGIFSQQRFAEDTDTDYFLRCFKAVKDRARDFLTKHRREG